MTGILLIAHGSRLSAANQDLVDLAAAVAARRPGNLVEIGYLELARPSVPEGLERCVARGATRIVMAPYFLSTGVHVTRDLETARADFAEQHPQIEVVLSRALELHPQIVEIVLERVSEAAD